MILNPGTLLGLKRPKATVSGCGVLLSSQPKATVLGRGSLLRIVAQGRKVAQPTDRHGACTGWSPRTGPRGGATPASNRATRCGGTSGGSSSATRGKCLARWYRRGCTEAAARRRGGGGDAGQRRSGVSGQQWWSVPGALVTGGEVRSGGNLGGKTRGGGAHREAEVAAMAAPNRRSGATSGAREGPRELAMRAGRLKELGLG
jgi:hypothetical protein